MAAADNAGPSFWGYLINHQEKMPQPLLAELCNGLTKVISQLEPGPDQNITPQRLAAFYTSVGGNDYIYRELGQSGLSLMYKTFGCFHSLQPSANAYEAPSVPCLLAPGFVRWQTVQLLLHPDEYAPCIQRAVEVYDVPRANGGKFPKSIPRECFPAKPDDAMVKWHSTILERLDDAPNKLKNSPYMSPYEPSDREGYFPPGSPHAKRASRQSRTDSPDPRVRVSSSSSRRRSSVPSMPSPLDPPDPLDLNYQWSSDHAFSAPNTALPQSPRLRFAVPPSTQRPTTKPNHRHSSSYSNASNGASTNNTTSRPFGINFENFHISSPFSSKKHRQKASINAAKHAARRQAGGRSGATSTGSDASSEESLPRPSRYDDYHDHRRRSSLAPPEEYNRHQRRHSHDSSYIPTPKFHPASPAKSPQTAHRYSPHQNYIPTPSPGLFRDTLFNNSAASSAPDSPVVDPANPKVRLIDPTGKLGRADTRGRPSQYQQPQPAYNEKANLQQRRAASADRRSSSQTRTGVDPYDNRYARQDRDYDREPVRGGRPLRVNTVTGSMGGGRPGRTPEIRSAGLSTPRRARK